MTKLIAVTVAVAALALGAAAPADAAPTANRMICGKLSC